MRDAPAALPVALLGLNFRAAPVEVRERLACGPERIPAVLQELLGGATPGCGSIREAVLLSTCNRTELYEAKHALSRLGPLTAQQEQVVRAMAKAIAGKLLHDPVTRLQELSQREDACAYLDLAQNLYRLP